MPFQFVCPLEHHFRRVLTRATSTARATRSGARGDKRSRAGRPPQDQDKEDLESNWSWSPTPGRPSGRAPEACRERPARAHQQETPHLPGSPACGAAACGPACGDGAGAAGRWAWGTERDEAVFSTVVGMSFMGSRSPPAWQRANELKDARLSAALVLQPVLLDLCATECGAVPGGARRVRVSSRRGTGGEAPAGLRPAGASPSLPYPFWTPQ